MPTEVEKVWLEPLPGPEARTKLQHRALISCAVRGMATLTAPHLNLGKKQDILPPV